MIFLFNQFIQEKDDNKMIIRTDQYNSKWLNSPQFVGSFEAGDFVYFVFREVAIEHINCVKVGKLNSHNMQYFTKAFFELGLAALT